MNRVREWRRLRNLTIEELARRSRTTASQISKLERGERRLTLDWMERLSGALGCRSQDLLPGQGQGSEPADVSRPLDRELLRRMGRALMKHMRKERLDISPPRFLEAAIALHDLIAARPPRAGEDELTPELTAVLRLLERD
jgi:transcriptional regulator with XRE-family HTH domain